MDKKKRGVLTLITGTTLAQAIPIAASPIITRMYAPEDFGVLATFTGISAIVGSIATGRYELAIMLPKTDKEATSVAVVSVLVTCFISFIVFAVFLIFNKSIETTLQQPDIGIWLYFIPITVLFMGVKNTLTYFNNRQGNFGAIAISSVQPVFFSTTARIGGGYFYPNASMLIISQILSSLFGNRILMRSAKFDFSKCSVDSIKNAAARYLDFPKYSMPGVLVNVLSQNLGSLLIPVLYSTSILGHFSLVQRLIGLPSSIIGNSVGQIFFQQAALERTKTGKASDSAKSALKQLLLIAIPVFLFAYFTVEPLFPIVFGPKWANAGVYAKILLPLLFVSFVSSPLSMILTIFEKQFVAMMWQLSLLILSVAAFLFSYYYARTDFLFFLKLYVVFNIVGYLTCLLLCIRTAFSGDVL